jgi:protein O-GlcNAc transferase
MINKRGIWLCGYSAMPVLHGGMMFRGKRRSVVGLVTMVVLVIAGGKASCQQAPVQEQTSANSAEAHLGKGYDALRQDRYDVAVNEFRAALALDPTLVLRARFPLGVALFELHKSDEARQEFEEVRRETGDHPNILYYLGRLDLENRNFEGAIHNLNQAAAKPPFPDTAYYLGFAYFKQGDLASAEKWLKTAARLNARDARIPYQLGLVYRKQGREEEANQAQALSDELRQREDKESRLRLECAQKLDQGPKQEAHAICDQLYDPENAEKLTELGSIYGQHGDLEAALKPLQRAAQLAPQSPQMQYNLALAYYQLNRFENARPPLADALKRWPDLFQLNTLYGAVLLKLGEDRLAYDALRHAIELNPQDSETGDLLYTTVTRLASKSREARLYTDSLRYLAEAAKLRPSDPEPHRRMAEIYTVTGRPAQATAEQQEADRLMKHFGWVQ